MIRLISNIGMAIFTLTAFLIAGNTAASDETPFVMHSSTVHGDGGRGPYDLGEPFIGGTVTAVGGDGSGNTVSIESEDSAAGTVVFVSPLADSDSVTLRYAVPPPWLKSEYRRPKGTQQPGISLPSDYRGAAEKTPKPFPGLRFGGSKTFDINLGSGRETALNQTLRLNINGQLSDDISLNAVISDQNVPITPEGDTRELSELDRVLIQIRGKYFRVDMGDTDLESSTGNWLSYTRRLSGALASVQHGNTEVFASGALSEGRHMSITITPIEGNQGPYRLNAENGNSDIAVIPGSEKVWINGERMTRGGNYDYTIDYSTGELTFTEHRMIGSDMRIVCDYEYTSESYRRVFYSGGGSGNYLGGKLKISAVAARESDDADRPVLFDIDDSMKSALAEAGDSPAAFSGLRPATGDSTGTYDMVDGILVYNPTKDGEYNATFSWVGEDKGSYRYKGGGVYEYVQPVDRVDGSGASYDPVALLDGPVTHDLAGLTVAFDPLESLHIEGESAGSSVDLNTLSSLDDGDNSGAAHRIGGSFSPVIGRRIPLRLMLNGRFQDRDERFKPLDRDRDAEENRRWGLPLVLDSTEERVTEYGGGLALHEGRFKESGFSLSGGSIKLGGEAQSDRNAVTGTLNYGEFLKSSTEIAAIERKDIPSLPDETIDRLHSRITGAFAGFTNNTVYERETAEGRGKFTHGARYNQIETGITTPSLFGFYTNADWLYRDEQSRNTTGWADSSNVRGGSMGVTLDERFPAMFRAQYSRRDREGGLQKGRTEQAVVETSWRPDSGRFSIDLSYRAGRARETLKSRNYIYAGTGRGSYRWEDSNEDGVRDPEEFIPDEYGEYYLYEETLDSYRPVNTVAVFNKTVFVLPKRFLAKTGFAEDVRFETSFEVNERSSADAADIFLLRLSKFRKNGTTASGDMRIQEDISAPLGDKGNVRLRVFRFASFDGEYVSGAERRVENEESLRFRIPVGEEWDLETTVKHELMTRKMEERISGNFEVDAYSGDGSIAWYPRSWLKVGGTASMGRDKDDVGDITAMYYVLKPALSIFFAGRGRIEASYANTTVNVDKPTPQTLLPYTMARGRKEGGNHDISVICDYRLSQRMNLVASYTGRRFADRDFEHFARTQLRALF